MRTPSSIAAVATLLLHGALVAAVVVNGITADEKQIQAPAPVKVALLTLPTPLPVAQPAPAPPTAPPDPPKKKPAAPRVRNETESSARRVDNAAQPAPETKQEPSPSTSTAVASPASSAPNAPNAPVAPATAAPAAPVAPVAASPAPARTSASEASYAASNRKPPYPRLSRSNGEEGTVVLRVQVRADGTAGAVEIKSSSGYPLLDESARSTVQAWRFKPATVDGKPVTEWYQLAVPFTLQNN